MMLKLELNYKKIHVKLYFTVNLHRLKSIFHSNPFKIVRSSEENQFERKRNTYGKRLVIFLEGNNFHFFL